MVETKRRKNRRESRKLEDRLLAPVPAASLPSPHCSVVTQMGAVTGRPGQARALSLHAQSLVDTSPLVAELQWEKAELF